MKIGSFFSQKTTIADEDLLIIEFLDGQHNCWFMVGIHEVSHDIFFQSDRMLNQSVTLTEFREVLNIAFRELKSWAKDSVTPEAPPKTRKIVRALAIVHSHDGKIVDESGKIFFELGHGRIKALPPAYEQFVEATSLLRSI